MDGAFLKRGEIIAYRDKNEIQYGVLTQNDIGNRFSPTVIISKVVAYQQTPLIHVVLENIGPLPPKAMILVEKMSTIDKKRIVNRAAMLSQEKVRELNNALKNCFGFLQIEQKENTENPNQLVFLNLGRDAVGSEQAGERPGIVLRKCFDGRKRSYVVALMTSQMTKKAMPTHVHYLAGEGGVLKPSVCLFEQLKEVSEEQIIRWYDYSPNEKVPNIHKALGTSLGILEKQKQSS